MFHLFSPQFQSWTEQNRNEAGFPTHFLADDRASWSVYSRMCIVQVKKKYKIEKEKEWISTLKYSHTCFNSSSVPKNPQARTGDTY